MNIAVSTIGTNEFLAFPYTPLLVIYSEGYQYRRDEVATLPHHSLYE